MRARPPICRRSSPCAKRRRASMAIEGPLRELGIHDVFQLLDLSRKTGALRVTSEMRDDAGDVLFDGGKVIHASVQSNPTSIERILKQAGKITDADLAAANAIE